VLPSNRYVISFPPPSGAGWSVAVCEHSGTQKQGNDMNCNNMSVVVSNTCCLLALMFHKPINTIFPTIRNIVPNANTLILLVSRLIHKVCLIFRAPTYLTFRLMSIDTTTGVNEANFEAFFLHFLQGTELKVSVAVY
jgi:hypothetical protein